MRALVYDGKLYVGNVPMPKPGEDEALIKVLTAGICNTDLEITKGYMGFKGIPGHEFVGIVEDSPGKHLIGKRVVGEINCVCGECRYCKLEMSHHCTNRTVLGIVGRNGAFAEYLTLPEKNLHLAPKSIRDDVAVFTEPLAAAFRIPEQIKIKEDDYVLVMGDGKLGQLVAQVMKLHTKRLICFGKHEWKMGLLNDLGIATSHVDEGIVDGADIVVDATGSADSLTYALDFVRPEGTIVLKTTVSDKYERELAGVVINEVSIIGSRCGPFRPALDALAAGTVEVRPMITELFALEDAVEAMERAKAPDVMKILLHM